MGVREIFEELKSPEQAVAQHAENDMANLPAEVERPEQSAIGALLAEIAKDVGQEMKHQAAHGAAELASALNLGNAFVQYPHNAEHDQQQEQQNEQDQGMGR